MNRLQKIKELPDFVKDTRNGSLLNVNNDSLKAYKAQKNNLNKINKHDEELATIKNEVSEIKKLLEELIKGLNVS
jgi:hypothetical protein